MSEHDKNGLEDRPDISTQFEDYIKTDPSIRVYDSDPKKLFTASDRQDQYFRASRTYYRYVSRLTEPFKKTEDLYVNDLIGRSYDIKLWGEEEREMIEIYISGDYLKLHSKENDIIEFAWQKGQFSGLMLYFNKYIVRYEKPSHTPDPTLESTPDDTEKSQPAPKRFFFTMTEDIFVMEKDTIKEVIAHPGVEVTFPHYTQGITDKQGNIYVAVYDQDTDIVKVDRYFEGELLDTIKAKAHINIEQIKDELIPPELEEDPLSPQTELDDRWRRAHIIKDELGIDIALSHIRNKQHRDAFHLP